MTSTRTSAAQLQLLCWRCATPLGSLMPATPRTCPMCKTAISADDGIWRSLSPRQVTRFDRFITDYEFIRAAEGRGSSQAAYYLSLPFSPSAHPLAGQWTIRARSFEYLIRHILPKTPQRVLDLGSGNAWLSHRLARMGHHPVAVDLLTNSQDGLGATFHYPVAFPQVQAALDQLPFADHSFDLAIFNASFHYSEDYCVTLGEAMRCVRPGGLIVIADSPWYAKESSGLRMVEEKQARFLARYGFASDALESQEFLTPARLDSLARELGLAWRIHKPFYGLAWCLRPLRALLKGQRPPSRFYLFVAQVPLERSAA